MKKWMIVPVILLAISGFLFIACPSAPEGAPSRIASDIQFDINGVYEYVFDDITIEKDKVYEVIINVKEVDDILAGCHFQGQLLYTLGGKKYLLAASQNAIPTNIADFGTKYRLTFTGWDFGTGNDSEDDPTKMQKGGYELPPAAVTSTPAGAVQYLKLTVKTPKWYVMGLPWDEQEVNSANAQDTPTINEGVDYYVGDAEGAGFTGDIKVRVKPDYNFIPGDFVSVTNPDAAWKGNIEDAEFQKLKDAPEDSVLRVSVTVVVTQGKAEPGWGVVEFGVTREYKRRGQNISIPVTIPRVWKNQQVTISTIPLSFYADILISDIVSYALKDDPDATLVFCNPYNGASVTGLQIFTPVSTDLPPEVQDMLVWYNKLMSGDLETLQALADKIKDLLH